MLRDDIKFIALLLPNAITTIAIILYNRVSYTVMPILVSY